jgi:hypothetical protein
MYNFIDAHFFKWDILRGLRSFILTYGEKK